MKESTIAFVGDKNPSDVCVRLREILQLRLTVLIPRHGDSTPTAPSALADSAAFAYVIGAPGSGKGTLCKQLVDNHDFIHLSIGDMLRYAAAQQRPNPEVFEHVHAGALVPVETLSTYLIAVTDSTQRYDPDSMYLIDGVPRKRSQIEHLESAMGLPAFVLFFTCTEATSRERVFRRNVVGRNDTRERFDQRYAELAFENRPLLRNTVERGQ